jgi:hypothetical protein
MKKIQLIIVCLMILPLLSFKPADQKPSIKVALILDTSNSMDGLIDQAKSQLWSVVDELSKARCDQEAPDLQIALYEYGNDQLSMREGYIRLVTPFTGDLDHISEKLFALKTDGGSEYYGQVIGTSLKQLDWEEFPKDLKLIFIAGNEPFDQGNVSYREMCKDAREMDITVNTIFCGDFNEGVQTYWKDGAYIGGGDYMNIDQDCKYVYIKSPYDDRLLKLNEELNKTYIAYGDAGKEMATRQAEQDYNAYEMDAEVAIKRAKAKSSSAYKNSQWDIVDAVVEESIDIEIIDDEELPEEMKDMTPEERSAYVEQKRVEREKIRAEINDLTQKRDEYVAEQRRNDPDNMLDKAIISAVSKQAIAKNFKFEK